MGYPQYRPRRMRKNETLRSFVRETRLCTQDFIYPLFVCEGKQIKEEIPSMPNVYHLSCDMLDAEITELENLGIQACILFGIPDTKDECGTGAYDENGIVQKAVRAIKKTHPHFFVICDVCMCEYTSHGHCGILDANGIIKNDESIELMAQIALSQVEAGADMVAPSNMLDGHIQAIRTKLDAHGYTDTPIMAYSVKYASAFYGPFRDAANSAPAFGDRKSYQMDPANKEEALREAALDIEEGADIIMVKPALSYLDVLYAVREKFAFPCVAYNVSGEYAMIKAAAQKGWIDEKRVALESLLSMKRAGACAIITYFAKDAAIWLSE